MYDIISPKRKVKGEEKKIGQIFFVINFNYGIFGALAIAQPTCLGWFYQPHLNRKDLIKMFYHQRLSSISSEGREINA